MALEEQTRIALIVGGALALATAVVVSLYSVYQKLSPYLVSHKRTPYSSKIRSGRYAALGHKNLVVFIIGMRINKWYRVDLWWKVLRAMAEMLRELQSNDKDLGFYGNETYGMAALLFGYPSIQVTYWESVEKLHEFSSGKSHKTGMKNFLTMMNRSNGAVGVYHELYEVSRAESIYRDMNEFGLLRAVGGEPALGSLTSSAGRLEECPMNATEHVKRASAASERISSCPFRASERSQSALVQP